MQKETVTGELKKSLSKFKINPYKYYSDPRKHKTAVGVKLDMVSLTQKQIDTVVSEMETKGYQFIKVTPKFSHSGIRLTFYKKEFSFLNKK